jgi:hypothetical protein
VRSALASSTVFPEATRISAITRREAQLASAFFPLASSSDVPSQRYRA